MQFIHVSELMKKLGIDESTIKSGKLKDAGSPFRKVLPEERAYFDMLIGDVYEQFVDVVAVERKLERRYVKRYADGRVFTGRQAQQLGFVDTLGTLEDAIMIAAKLARIEGRPSIVKEVKRSTLMERMFGDAAATLTRVREEFLAQPILQYKLTSPY
jgi:protease-4